MDSRTDENARASRARHGAGVRGRSTSAAASIRLRCGAGTRHRFVLWEGLRERDVEERKERMRALAERLGKAGHSSHARQLLARAAEARDNEELDEIERLVAKICAGEYRPLQRIHAGMTFRELGGLWTSGELHERWPDHVKAKKSADDDAGRFDKHIYPLVGDVLVAEFTLEDAERVMRKIPAKRSAASRRHVAQLIHRVMALAVYPCRIREASPIPRGWLPHVGPKKAFPILYPAEDARLLAFEDIPLLYRLLYGFLHREGMRRGEAVSLTWSDIDLDHGVVKLDENKTDHPRWWKLGAGVTEALTQWRSLRSQPKPEELVFVAPNGEQVDIDHLAERIRADLKRADVTRTELFSKGKNWGRFGAHCLRHSFVTRSLANGATEDWVRQRTGHRSNELLRYREVARSLAELELGDVTSLLEAIPELRKAAKVGRKVGHQEGEKVRRSQGDGESANDSEVVHERGLEPPHLSVPEPKSGASASSATRARRAGNRSALRAIAHGERAVHSP